MKPKKKQIDCEVQSCINSHETKEEPNRLKSRVALIPMKPKKKQIDCEVQSCINSHETEKETSSNRGLTHYTKEEIKKESLPLRSKLKLKLKLKHKHKHKHKHKPNPKRKPKTNLRGTNLAFNRR